MSDSNKGYRIYYNLHKGGFTVQHYINGKGWRKLDTIDSLMAYNVTFKVYDHGRLKVIEEQRKNVHAFILCEAFSTLKLSQDLFSKQLYYNPYKTAGFQDKDSCEEVEYVSSVYLDSVVKYNNGKKVGIILYNR